MEKACGVRPALPMWQAHLLAGKERFDVSEYCVSEGWIKVPAGKTLDRKGNPLLIKIKGTVEAFYK